MQQSIAFVHSNNFEVGGSDIVMWRVAVAALRKGYRVTVVLSKRNPIVSRYLHEDIPIFFIPQPRLSRTKNPLTHARWLLECFRATCKLAAFYNREKIQIVFANDFNELSAAAAAKLTRRPCLTRIRFVLDLPWILRRPYLALLTFFSTNVLCVSEAVRQFNFVEHSSSKVTTLYDWYSPGPRAAADSAHADAFAPFGFKPGTKIVLMPGRMEEWKGQHVLIEASSQILKVFPDAGVLVVGSSVRGRNREDYAGKLKLRASALGLRNIVFHEHVENIEDLICSASVVVHCSVKPEPFGMTVLEALWHGTPLVTTRAGGPLEIVGDPPAALLHEPGDAGDLASKVITTLKDTRTSSEMAERGKARARLFQEEYQWAKFEEVLAAAVEN
jgi:glycosyltransferase involved in cell wall biosynthesis